MSFENTIGKGLNFWGYVVASKQILISSIITLILLVTITILFLDNRQYSSKKIVRGKPIHVPFTDNSVKVICKKNKKSDDNGDTYTCNYSGFLSTHDSANLMHTNWAKYGHNPTYSWSEQSSEDKSPEDKSQEKKYILTYPKGTKEPKNYPYNNLWKYRFNKNGLRFRRQSDYKGVNVVMVILLIIILFLGLYIYFNIWTLGKGKLQRQVRQVRSTMDILDSLRPKKTN